MMEEGVVLSVESFMDAAYVAVVHLWGHASAQMSGQELPMEPAGPWHCRRYHGYSYEERVSSKRG